MAKINSKKVDVYDHSGLVNGKPFDSITDAAKFLKISRIYLKRCIEGNKTINGSFKANYSGELSTSTMVVNVKKQEDISKKLIDFIKDKEYTLEQICDQFNLAPKVVREKLDSLRINSYNVQEKDNTVTINTKLVQGGKHTLNYNQWQGDVIKFGFVSDNHLCNVNERLDVLHMLYDLYEQEGITIVYNAGNWIDGEAKFNKNELHTKGMTKQIEYAVNNYPFRHGVETHFIAGDDHEGWYVQREGINIGEYFQMKREKAGMFDLKYLGYLEADINLNDESFKNPAWLRVLHPGGGSAYATSYAPQKIVESYQGGEKPTILLIGHYHKMGYDIIRNVHSIQCGTTEDQSLFMRKQKIAAHVGGGIAEFRRASDGTINRGKVEFITAYDKKFYIGDKKYWK